MSLEGINALDFEYTLTLRGQNGDEELVWNPHLSSLRWKEADRPVDLGAVGRRYETRQYGLANEVTPDTPGRKSHIRWLKIQLGFKCNRACSYCNQALHAPSSLTGFEDVRPFLENLHKVFKPANGTGEGHRVEFWGGEPLVYWKHLKILAGTLRSLYPELEMNVVSNGDLLDEEKIGFFKEHRIGLGLSHDGPAMMNRGDDPLDDPARREMWRRAVEELGPDGRIGFNTVLTRDNFSLDAVRTHIERRLGVPPGSIAHSTEEILLPYDDDAMLMVPWLPEEHAEARHTLFFEAVTRRTVPSNHTVTRKLEDLFHAIATARPSYALMQKCGMDREDALAIDLKGNITTCQNTSADMLDGHHAIGRGFDLAGARLDTAHHMLSRDECRQCPVVQMCKGACMFLEGDYWRAACDVSFTYNVALFAAALHYLTGGLVLTRIAGRTIRRDEVGDSVQVIDVEEVMRRVGRGDGAGQRAASA